MPWSPRLSQEELLFGDIVPMSPSACVLATPRMGPCTKGRGRHGGAAGAQGDSRSRNPPQWERTCP